MGSRILTPLAGEEIQEHPFLTYDFEWYPETPDNVRNGRAYQIRVASFYDGTKHVGFAHPSFADPRVSKSGDPVGAFLDTLLTPKYAGYRFYAHWGGIADALYLFRAIHDRRLQTRIVVNGSAAAIILIESCPYECEEACKHKRYRWTFVDSSFLFRFSLKKLAQLMGMSKGGEEGLSWETEDDTKLTTYNFLDNEILYKAIDRLQGIVNDMGAQMGMTMASTSMDLFRRCYLRRDITTPDQDNAFSKKAYYASRVEPYRFHMAKGYAYDVNSSFVYSMTFPLPGSPVAEQWGSLPKPGALYIADVDIEIPEMYLPPLPYRHTDGRIFFPTGRWSGVYTSVDIELALAVGATVHAVRRVVLYEERHDLKNFAEDVYAKRMEASDKFLYTAIKLLGNGAYGKFGESEEKDEYLMHPKSTLCERHYKLTKKGTLVCCSHAKHDCPVCYEECDCMAMIAPGIWKFGNVREVQHRHTQIGAFITSIARRTLYQGQYAYQEHLHYSDTDCVHLSCTMTPENKRGHLDHTPSNSDQLGGFKLEGERTEMIYIAPKIYGGKDGKGDPLIAAKGFRVGGKVMSPVKGREVYSDESVQKFKDLVDGKPVFDSHMVRPREYLSRMHEVERPYDVKVGAAGKRLQLGQRPKRKRVGENETAPWSVAELLKGDPW